MTGTKKARFDFSPMAGRYERWYETKAGRAHDAVQKRDVTRLLAPAQPGQTLLDVGSGTGHWSRFFDSLGYRVQGVDVSPAMVTFARYAVPECTFDVADAHRLPFDDGSFDVVAAMAVLEFVTDANAMLDEMARCTRRGGTLLVGTLNGRAPLNRRRHDTGKQPYASADFLAPGPLRRRLQRHGHVQMYASRVDTKTESNSLEGPFIVATVDL